MKTIEEMLPKMHAWMNDYVRTFYTDDAEIQRAIRVKEVHTGYVTANCRELARHLELSSHDIAIAECMGLFHDVGRFRQFTLYKTFVDAESEDHALLALESMDELPFFHELPAGEYSLLRFAIYNHNKKEIEETSNRKYLTFAKMIRDADKLDIYRVLAPYIAPSGKENVVTFSQTKLRTAGFSENFLEQFTRGEQCDYRLIRTQDDRKLVRLMWVYDINYAWTLQRVVDRGYVRIILDNLPHSDALKPGVERMQAYIRKKLMEEDSADF